MLTLNGDISLATEIALLKRQLSSCHDLLGDHPSETNYLSIVCLVESALTGLKFRHFDRPRLEALRRALDVGCRNPEVQYQDVKMVRQLFQQEKVDIMPRIDLLSLTPEDLEDDGEEAS
jgi:hypothetical protein